MSILIYTCVDSYIDWSTVDERFDNSSTILLQILVTTVA